MGNERSALWGVAAVFFLVGVLSLTDMVFGLVRGNLSINLGVLGFFVGAGLLRHSRPWWIAALVCAGLTSVASLLLAVAVLASSGPIAYSGGGHEGTLPAAAAVGLGVLGVALGLWQLRVLTRPSVKQRFQTATPG